MADYVEKAKHMAAETAGTAKEKVGEATGNDDLRSDGATDQVEANAHQAADAVSDGAEKLSFQRESV